jgi:hypothetical protein
MKMLLLAGVAALSISAAQAKPLIKWQCGRTLVILHESSFGAPKHFVSIEFKPISRRSLYFEWDTDFERKSIDEPETGRGEADYGTATGGEAFLNGKRCNDYVPRKRKEQR